MTPRDDELAAMQVHGANEVLQVVKALRRFDDDEIPFVIDEPH